jgi:predicted secreted protein
MRAIPMIMVLALLIGFSICDAVETVVVDKAFNGREIKVRTDTMIQVELEQASTAGYMWEIEDLDKKHFEVVSVKMPEPPERPDLVGAPVKKTWLIRATEKGKSEIRLIHYRTWEGKEKAADTFVLKVSII